jgi:hypothetical protein
MADGSVSTQTHIAHYVVIVFFSDGAIDPPHFYIAGDGAWHTLFHYTGMTEHPQLPSIKRSRIHDIPPPANIMEPPAAPAAPASSAVPAASATPAHAPSPAEDLLAGKFTSLYSSLIV